MRKCLPFLLLLLLSCSQSSSNETTSKPESTSSIFTGVQEKELLPESSEYISRFEHPLEYLDWECKTSIFSSDLPSRNVGEEIGIDPDHMKLRPGGSGDLLVPESWEVSPQDSACNLISEDEILNIWKVWKNPLNDNEAVFYRSSRLNEEDSPPYYDATWDIHNVIGDHVRIYQNQMFELGSTLKIHEMSQCLFNFNLYGENYLLDGVWLAIEDDMYVVSYIVREKVEGNSDFVANDFVESLRTGHSYTAPEVKFPKPSGPDDCTAMSNLNFDWQTGPPPSGAATYNRRSSVDPLNITLTPGCLNSNSDDLFGEITLSDGFWEDDNVGLEEEPSSVALKRISYADLIVEPMNIELELIVGLLCKEAGKTTSEVHAFSFDSGNLTPIGRPIAGYFASVFDSGENIYHAGSGGGDGFYFPERILIVRPERLFETIENPPETHVCCENNLYENLYVWNGSDWSPEEYKKESESGIPGSGVTPFPESFVFDPFLEMGHREDCVYYESADSVTEPYQTSGVNVSVHCIFEPTGTNITFDADFEYALTVSGGNQSDVDTHVRSQLREILDWWLENNLIRVFSAGGYVKHPLSTASIASLELDATVSFQSDRFYSVEIIFENFRPWWFNFDTDVSVVVVDKNSGDRLVAEDLFNSSLNWKKEVSELIQNAAELKYPSCSLNYLEDDFELFSLTNTGLRFFFYLSPNACGLGSIDLGFQELNKYLSDDFLADEVWQ